MTPTPVETEATMGMARLSLARKGDWHVEHNGKVAHAYAIKEAAFEATAAPGTNAAGTAN
jgi:hypothetical protein